MLRASVTATNATVDLAAIADPMLNPQLPASHELRCLVDAVVLRDTHERDVALASLVEMVGDEGAVRAAAVVGNFEMMNRLLDGTGVGPSAQSAQIAPELGVPWPTQ